LKTAVKFNDCLTHVNPSHVLSLSPLNLFLLSFTVFELNQVRLMILYYLKYWYIKKLWKEKLLDFLVNLENILLQLLRLEFEVLIQILICFLRLLCINYIFCLCLLFLIYCLLVLWLFRNIFNFLF